ncbi:hypothetical protein GUJ93_ZPchr0007g5159 [Zizania palustris]|uniref:Uncharacterized protein n=1 Tax=Zizania palustris TaxID=103762 RepID=A0A8J5VUG5_ZIZPA|nr:hypothetical protein GUJ93_ZPchr0007g5159 [Zizania palustris]
MDHSILSHLSVKPNKPEAVAAGCRDGWRWSLAWAVAGSRGHGGEGAPTGDGPVATGARVGVGQRPRARRWGTGKGGLRWWAVVAGGGGGAGRRRSEAAAVAVGVGARGARVYRD